MSIFSTTETFGPYPAGYPDAVIMVKTNGGSLTIESVMSDGTAVPMEGGTIAADEGFAMSVARGTFKATPAGGCVYEWRA